ncbi:MAG: FAD-binding oxidoreductase [Pseudomonadota bacterium]|nr:FAD-binding oxidoreductase [Pseudomonadota bacterium]
MTIDTADICIVGGGIIGMYAAYRFAEEGKTVRLIDKLYAGSSRYNIGDILHAGHVPSVTPFMRYSYEKWREAGEKHEETFGLERRGSVYFSRTESQHISLLAESTKLKDDGVDCFYESDLEALKEHLQVNRLSDAVRGALIAPRDAAINSRLAVDALRKHITQGGVKIWGSDAVEEFIFDGENKIIGVKTDSGEECHAGTTIITSGIWSNRFLTSIKGEVPMRPARCHVIQAFPNGKVPHQMIGYRLKYGEILAKYLDDGRMLISYTALKDPAQATGRTETDDHAVEFTMRNFADLLTPMEGAKLREVNVMSTAVTPDYAPYLGQSEQYEGLTYAIGFNGKSYAYAAGVADVLCDLTSGSAPKIDISAFSPHRTFGKK